jgi:hypothetical protein
VSRRELMKNGILKSVKPFTMLKIGLPILCLLLLFAVSGCSNSTMEFNHYKWVKAKENASWDVRRKMAQYLLNNQTLIEKSKQEVIEILGTAEHYSDVESNELYYTIELKYGSDIDPIKIEYLIVSLDSKETVTKVYRKVALIKT